ncbi:MAG: hypothetical protein DMG04_21615 [Acidobacteria bacterium]|nr:MAG: hypothetical protein DMG04_21615 [Acidobacteriota bacterium]PYQ86204.1 MAG: hypothetical protein DMG03_07645 [Acidobacteriota bacterium]PYQ92250.1 MAG: hypothetical protein DMG02_02295 [Acidobacteriota bacterium]PYR10493.1 MAG: hypothetical protein DMF99_11675 [Acidobacteriota bacterium]
MWTANRRRTTFELRFDAYAFLESAGLAKRVVMYRRRDLIFSQGDPCDTVMFGTTRSRVNFFLNKFRKLGFIEYDTTSLTINPSLLTIVVHE